MRQAPDIQRASFSFLQKAPHGAGRPTKTPDQIVITAINAACFQQPNRTTRQETQQTAPRIGAYVRRESISGEVRQPVDEGRIAEMIAAAPKVPVRFKRVPAIRAENDGASARLQYPNHFLQGLAVVLNVLQHLIGQHRIKAVARVGKPFRGGDERVRRGRSGLQHPIRFNVKEFHPCPVTLVYLPGVHAGSTAGFQHQRALKPGMARNHPQTTFLARTPNVTGFPAQGCLWAFAGSHNEFLHLHQKRVRIAV